MNNLTKSDDVSMWIDEYKDVTDFDWVRYELATIYHDFLVHVDAQARISRLIDNLEDALAREYESK